MIREDVDLNLIYNIVKDRNKLNLTKCDVVQMVFVWEVTWPLLEPTFKEFWEVYPEAYIIYLKKLADVISPEDEEREMELMQQWDLDNKGEKALAPFVSLINWSTGSIKIPNC